MKRKVLMLQTYKKKVELTLVEEKNSEKAGGILEDREVTELASLKGDRREIEDINTFDLKILALDWALEQIEKKLSEDFEVEAVVQDSSFYFLLIKIPTENIS